MMELAASATAISSGFHRLRSLPSISTVDSSRQLSVCRSSHAHLSPLNDVAMPEKVCCPRSALPLACHLGGGLTPYGQLSMHSHGSGFTSYGQLSMHSHGSGFMSYGQLSSQSNVAERSFFVPLRGAAAVPRGGVRLQGFGNSSDGQLVVLCSRDGVDKTVGDKAFGGEGGGGIAGDAAAASEQHGGWTDARRRGGGCGDGDLVTASKSKVKWRPGGGLLREASNERRTLVADETGDWGEGESRAKGVVSNSRSSSSSRQEGREGWNEWQRAQRTHPISFRVRHGQEREGGLGRGGNRRLTAGGVLPWGGRVEAEEVEGGGDAAGRKWGGELQSDVESRRDESGTEAGGGWELQGKSAQAALVAARTAATWQPLIGLPVEQDGASGAFQGGRLAAGRGTRHFGWRSSLSQNHLGNGGLGNEGGRISSSSSSISSRGERGGGGGGQVHVGEGGEGVDASGIRGVRRWSGRGGKHGVSADNRQEWKKGRVEEVGGMRVDRSWRRKDEANVKLESMERREEGVGSIVDVREKIGRDGRQWEERRWPERRRERGREGDMEVEREATGEGWVSFSGEEIIPEFVQNDSDLVEGVAKNASLRSRGETELPSSRSRREEDWGSRMREGGADSDSSKKGGDVRLQQMAERLEEKGQGESGADHVTEGAEPVCEQSSFGLEAERLGIEGESANAAAPFLGSGFSSLALLLCERDVEGDRGEPTDRRVWTPDSGIEPQVSLLSPVPRQRRLSYRQWVAAMRKAAAGGRVDAVRVMMREMEREDGYEVKTTSYNALLAAVVNEGAKRQRDGGRHEGKKVDGRGLRKRGEKDRESGRESEMAGERERGDDGKGSLLSGSQLTILQTALEVEQEMLQMGVKLNRETHELLLEAATLATAADVASTEGAASEASSGSFRAGWNASHEPNADVADRVAEAAADMAAERLRILEAAGFAAGRRAQRRVVEAMAKAGRVEQAEEEVRRMLGRGTQLDTLMCHVMIGLYGKVGQLQKAAAVFRGMGREEECMPNLRTFKLLVAMYVREGHPEEANQMLQEMTRRGIQGDEDIFCQVMQSYAAKGNAKEAEAVLRSMLSWGIVATARSFHTVIDAFRRKADPSTVELLMEEMVRYGIPPRSDTQHMLMDAYGRAGDIAKAESLMRGLSELAVGEGRGGSRGSGDGVGRGVEGDEREEGDRGGKEEALMVSEFASHEGKWGLEGIVEVHMRTAAAAEEVSHGLLFNSHEGLISEKRGAVEERIRDRDVCEGSAPQSVQDFPADGSCTSTDVDDDGGEDDDDIEVDDDDGQDESEDDDGEDDGVLLSDLKTNSSSHGGSSRVALYANSSSTSRRHKASYVKAVDVDGIRASSREQDVVHFTSLLHACLRQGQLDRAVAAMSEMRERGVAGNHVTWTVVVGGAARSAERRGCLLLLRELAAMGFDLPFRLLRSSDAYIWEDTSSLLRWLLTQKGEDAAQGMANVLVELLWCFGQRGSAKKTFLLAVEGGVFPQFVAKVAAADWHSNLRGLSPAAALVALHDWLGRIQDAALLAAEEPKLVLIVTGSGDATSDRVSIKKTVHSYLWAMGSPFRPSESHEGALMAKGHALVRWVKDSPQCVNLDLENSSLIPSQNTMQLYEGALMRADVVPLVMKLTESGIENTRSKVFSRLLRIPEDKRNKWIEMQASGYEGRKEREEKRRKKKLKNRLRRRERRPKVAKAKSVSARVISFFPSKD